MKNRLKGFGPALAGLRWNLAQGFRALLLGVDVAFLTAGAKSAQSQVKR